MKQDGKMNRSQKFLFNTITSAAYQVVVMVVGFILPRVMIIYYGSEINGLVTSITQFVSYFNLVEAGLSGATVYALYKPLANRDNEALSKVVTAAKTLYFHAGWLYTGLIVIMALVYPFFIHVADMSSIMVSILIVLLGASGFLDFFTLAKYRTILTADQRTYVISLTSCVYMLLNAAIISFLAYCGANIIVMRGIATSSIMLRSVIIIVYMKMKYPDIRYNVEPDYRAMDKRWSAMYLQFLGVIQKGAPTILATMFTSLKTVSVYAVYNMVLLGLNSLLDIFMSGLSSAFGEIISRKETNVLQKAYRDFEFAYYMIITVVYTTAMIMIMPFIMIYTSGITDTNYNLPIVGYLLVFNGFLYNIKTPQGMLVIAAGLFKETRIQSSIQAGIIIVLGAVLAYFYGLPGIVIALCLSNIYRVIDLVIFVPSQITELPVRETTIRILMSVLSGSISGFIVSCFDLDTNSIVVWGINAVLVFVVTTMIYIVLAVILLRNQFLSVMKRIVSVMKLR